jgi:hypothetical protein
MFDNLSDLKNSLRQKVLNINGFKVEAVGWLFQGILSCKFIDNTNETRVIFQQLIMLHICFFAIRRSTDCLVSRCC